MNISGKIRVFVNKKGYTNERGIYEEFNEYLTSLAKKDEEGLTDNDYIRAYLPVRFSLNLGEAYNMDDFEEGTCLEVNIKEGWLDFRFWQDSEGNIRKQFYIFVNGGTVEEYDPEAEEKQEKKTTRKSTVKKVASKAKKTRK